MAEMKKFLDYNDIAYNLGRAFVKNMKIDYYVENTCFKECLTDVMFNVQYDNEDNVAFTKLEADIIYTGFSCALQKFSFDTRNNTLLVAAKNKRNKHNKRYEVSISLV